MPANDCEICSTGGMTQKLSNEAIAVGSRFSKEQYPRRVTIDAVYDKGPLSFESQFFRQNRKSGRSGRVLGRHRQEFGRFIQSHYGIVLVKHGKLP